MWSSNTKWNLPSLNRELSIISHVACLFSKPFTDINIINLSEIPLWSEILVITMGKTMTACHPGLKVNNAIRKAIVRCWNKHYEKLSRSGKGSKNH